MGVQEGVEIVYLVGSKLSICFQLLFLSTQLYGPDSVPTDRPSWQWPFLVSEFKRKKKPKPNNNNLCQLLKELHHILL